MAKILSLNLLVSELRRIMLIDNKLCKAVMKTKEYMQNVPSTVNSRCLIKGRHYCYIQSLMGDLAAISKNRNSGSSNIVP